MALVVQSNRRDVAIRDGDGGKNLEVPVTTRVRSSSNVSCWALGLLKLVATGTPSAHTRN